MSQAVPTAHLIHELRVLSAEFTTTLNEESGAIRAAKFGHAIGLQDRKIELHQKLFTLLETLKAAPKDDHQRAEIKLLIGQMSASAQENKKSIEVGFTAIERISGRIMGLLRKAAQKDSASYTASGTYYRTRTQATYTQTNETA